MSDLYFKEISLADFDRVYAITSRYGEGSCQHSFVTMYSLQEKYGDQICFQDGFLYTLRSNLDKEGYRVYLAPLGEGDYGKAFRKIQSDAHEFGKKVKYISLTETAKNLLIQEFPGQYEITEEAGLAEYIYFTEKMASFSGMKLAKRRHEVNQFWQIYGNRAQVSIITPEDFPEILAFEEAWLQDNLESHDKDSLLREQREIKLHLDHFADLTLSGIVLRIDGEIHGFSYGTKLSNDYYDAPIEKCDRHVLNCYRVVRQESVRQCAMDCRYVNLEEDLNVEGLRNLKLNYKPKFIIRKYIATEI